MIGWHGTARHWAAGDRACRLQAPEPATQNGVDVLTISNLAIGFLFLWNWKLN